jgi:hypothetical protein
MRRSLTFTKHGGNHRRALGKVRGREVCVWCDGHFPAPDPDAAPPRSLSVGMPPPVRTVALTLNSACVLLRCGAVRCVIDNRDRE